MRFPTKYHVATIMMFLQVDSHSRILLVHMYSWETNNELLKFVFMYRVHEQM